MRALSYLVIKRFKNWVLTLKRKPAFLVLYGFVFLMIAGSLIAMMIANKGEAIIATGDERIVFFILAALSLLYLILFIVSGLSTGATLFTMPDVGLLFVAPISPKKILLYGLLSSMGKAMLGSVFIIYQATNLKVNFNYGFKEIFWLFIIYAIMTLFSQLLSIAVYIFTNQRPNRKRLVKAIMYTFVGGLALALLLTQRQQGVNLFKAALHMINSEWFGYIPVTGWAVMFFKGVTGGLLAPMLVSLGFFFVISILIILLLTFNEADYYEDVLVSTEMQFARVQAAREGRSMMPGNVLKKIKARDLKFGYIKGTGAVSLANRHLLEVRRGSRFMFIDAYTVIASIACGIAGYYIKGNPSGGYIVLGVAVYIQYFFITLGKLKQELSKHFIYLIPDVSFKKVFWGSLSSLLKPLVDGIFMFLIFAVMGGADVLTSIFLGISYAASGIVFVGFTLIIQRLIGGQPNKLVQSLITLGIFFIVIVPIVAVTIIVGYCLPEPLKFLTMLPYIIYCLLFALLLIFLSKDMFDKMEYNMR
jgi:hypothetical protein